MDRKKQLKELYKQMKPDMGVYIVESKLEKKCHIEATSNLKSGINSTVFKLNLGAHPNKNLQQAWSEHGEDKFEIRVLDQLEYSKDESKTDYSNDLAELQAIWVKEYQKNGMEFY